MNRIFSGFFFLACLFWIAGYADVPPEPGYVFRSISVRLETKDDLSDYRFFLESPLRIEEINIAKGNPTIIDGSGRVGAARVGALWAIPRRTIPENFDFSNPDNLQSFRQALDQGMYHSIKLLSLNFRTAIRDSDQADWRDPVYRLDKHDEVVTAALVDGDAGQNVAKGPLLYSTEPKSSAFWAAVLTGGALTLAFIAVGAWALRRARLKAMEGDPFTR